MDWHTFETTPPPYFDVLARYYDAGLNRFLIQRFCNCFIQGMSVIWPSPFPGDGHSVDLQAHGYRPVRWTAAPELPDDLQIIPSGPEDYPHV